MSQCLGRTEARHGMTTSGGQVSIELLINQKLNGVNIKTERPMVSRLLYGKTPVEAMALVPRLLSLCRHAQKMAIQSALAHAGAAPPPDATDFSALWQERVIEHLWRLRLDWPAYFSLPQHLSHFAQWRQRLSKEAPQAASRALLNELWPKDCQWGVFEELKHALHANAFLSILDNMPDDHFIPILPLSEGAKFLDVQHCLREGRAAETGLRSRFPEIEGGWIERRLLARVLDLRACLETASCPANTLSVLSLPDQEGRTRTLAQVETARGLLIHSLILHNGRIFDYHIAAPTEWNFHSASLWPLRLLELRDFSVDEIRRAAQAMVLTLDPCVPCQITEVHYA